MSGSGVVIGVFSAVAKQSSLRRTLLDVEFKDNVSLYSRAGQLTRSNRDRRNHRKPSQVRLQHCRLFNAGLVSLGLWSWL